MVLFNEATESKRLFKVCFTDFDIVCDLVCEKIEYHLTNKLGKFKDYIVRVDSRDENRAWITIYFQKGISRCQVVYHSGLYEWYGKFSFKENNDEFGYDAWMLSTGGYEFRRRQYWNKVRNHSLRASDLFI